MRGTRGDEGRTDAADDADLANETPALATALSGNKETCLRVEEGGEVRGTAEGDRAEKEGEGQVAEGFGDA